MEPEKMQVPQGALRMVASGCHAHVEFAQEGEENKKPRLDMLAYSGKVIKNHWWWGDLAIDISGIQFGKKKYPILENHETNRKIAFSSAPPSTENNELRFNPDKVSFVDTPYSKEFQKLSSEGFPYESSIYVTPTNIEHLEAGASAEVNGYTMKGPGTIFRKCAFNEASVCVFGWDRQTQSSAFSQNEKTEIPVYLSQINNTERTEEVTNEMDLAQLKNDHPELVKQIQDDVRTELSQEIEKQKGLFSTEVTTLRTEMSKKDERILDLEKRDAIRAEKELASFADKIWTSKLAASNIPERFYDKIQKHVPYGKFVKSEILDEVAFTKAIEDEIADWEGRGITGEVLGTSFSIKTEVDSNTKLAKKEKEENAGALANLLKIAGHKEGK